MVDRLNRGEFCGSSSSRQLSPYDERKEIIGLIEVLMVRLKIKANKLVLEHPKKLGIKNIKFLKPKKNLDSA